MSSKIVGGNYELTESIVAAVLFTAHAPITATDIARVTDFAPAVVSRCLAILIEKKLCTKIEADRSNRTGRPYVPLIPSTRLSADYFLDNTIREAALMIVLLKEKYSARSLDDGLMQLLRSQVSVTHI